jgi:hypothetical protein
MDRLSMTRGCLTVLGLISLLGATGCRGGRPEVPPERPYMTPASAPTAPQVGFSSEPAANAFAGASTAMPPGMGLNHPAASGSYTGQPTNPLNGSGAAPASFEPPQTPKGVMGQPGALPPPL